MSAAYELRKLYVDAIGPAGEVAVRYLTAVRLAGAWFARHGLEHYAPDGTRRAFDLGGREVPAWETALAGVRPILGSWAPPPSPLGAVLDWRVRHVRADVALACPGASVAGTGYADWIRITRPTRLLGLRSLVWGRVHLPDRTVVFEHLETAGAEPWQPGIDWRVGEAVPRPLRGPVRLQAGGEGMVALEDGDLVLRPLRVLHDGDAFDAVRVPGAVVRWLCHALGGPTWETRWLGIAAHRGVEAPALYERVLFGR